MRRVSWVTESGFWTTIRVKNGDPETYTKWETHPTEESLETNERGKLLQKQIYSGGVSPEEIGEVGFIGS